MRIVQLEDGGGELIFSEDEIKILNEKGKLVLTAEGLRHFGNVLVKLVAEFQTKFDDKTKYLQTHEDTKIEGK